jgi:hypothetical protein
MATVKQILSLGGDCMLQWIVLNVDGGNLIESDRQSAEIDTTG